MQQSLELLLALEYDSDSVSPKCKRLVIDFIRANESVLDEDIINIKRLTKKGYHILVSDANSLGGLIDRLFFFSIEGVMRVEQVRRARNHEINELDLSRMESHLHGYAANVARALFRKTRYLYWGEQWYWHHIESAKISIRIGTKEDLVYCAGRYTSAAEAAEAVYTQNGELEYGERWCEARRIKADIDFELKREDYAFDYLSAGYTFKTLTDETADNAHAIKYAREAIYCYGMFLGYFEQHKEQPHFKIQSLMHDVQRIITTLSQRFGM